MVKTSSGNRRRSGRDKVLEDVTKCHFLLRKGPARELSLGVAFRELGRCCVRIHMTSKYHRGFYSDGL